MAASLLTLGVLTSSVFGLSVNAKIEPARVRVGEAATLSIRIDDGDTPEPVSVPEVDGLSIEFSGTRRSFQFINGRGRSETALTYRVVPRRAGSFTIPPLTLRRGSETITTGPVRLLAYAGSARSPRPGGMVGGQVLVSKNAVVTGEPVLLRYYLVHTGSEFTRAPVFEAMPAIKGFLLRQIEERLPDEIVKAGGGELVRSHLATFAAVPLEAGRFLLGGGSVHVTVAESDPGSFFPFVVPATRRVDFDTVPVSVAPLPAAGRPSGFKGDVGEFALRVVAAEGDPAAFTGHRITVKVAGKGNLVSMSGPELAGVPGLSVMGGEGKLRLEAMNGTIGGEREFVYTVVPERAGSFVLPGPAISFYSPASGRYETARAADIRLEVAPGGKARRGTAAGDDDPGTRAPEFDPLLVLGIVLMVAGGVGALVLWRRKERAFGDAAPVAAGEPPVPAPARAGDPRVDLANAARRRDAAGFLKIAERMITEEMKSAEGGMPTRDVEQLRREIGEYRYAGRVISDAEMEGLYRRLKELRR